MEFGKMELSGQRASEPSATNRNSANSSNYVYFWYILTPSTSKLI